MKPSMQATLLAVSLTISMSQFAVAASLYESKSGIAVAVENTALDSLIPLDGLNLYIEVQGNELARCLNPGR